MVKPDNGVHQAPPWKPHKRGTTAQTILEQQNGVGDKVDGHCESVTGPILEEGSALAAIAVKQATVMVDAQRVALNARQAA